MVKGKSVSKLLPYIVALISFAAVCILYFAPQFEGRSIRMHDIVQYEGAAKDINDHKAQYGEDPQWTGNSFSGMPASLISMDYDSQILKRAFPALEFMGRPASLIFIAMLSFFVMLLLFGVNPWVGIVSALAYGLSTYFFIIIGAGHITKMVALAYAPLMVGGVYYTLRRNMWLGAALTALFASLQIAANHPQITYYFALVIFALWINELVRAVRKKLLPRFAKATGLLAVAAVLALGSNLAPLWYINEYSEDSIRGGSELTFTPGQAPAAQSEGAVDKRSGLELGYATQWSYGVGESFNMFIPNLYGGSSEGNFSDDGTVAGSLTKYGERRLAPHLPSYWGEQPVTAGPTYIGAVILFFGLLGLFLLPGRKSVWVAAVTLLAVMLAWGHNFMWLTELFYRYFPGYDKFRTVPMILVIVEWSVPFLGALTIHKLWKSATADGMLSTQVKEGAEMAAVSRERIVKGLKYSLSILGGIAVFFLLSGGAVFDFSSPSDTQMGLPDDVLAAMRQERASMLRSDSLRSLIFVVLAAGTALLYAFGKIKRGWMVAALALLVCVDLVAVNMRFLPQEKFVRQNLTQIKATPADLEILQDKELGFRVANFSLNPFNDATTSYFHRSIGGYHGAKMQRYQDVIEGYLSRMSPEVYNMLNTKYIINFDDAAQEYFVSANPDAGGAAWFVEDVRLVENPDEEFLALAALDTRNEAVVDRRFAAQLENVLPQKDSSARIELVEYKANHLTYRYYAPQESVAVFSEIYYDKGWQAYIDGEPAPHFRANYILRGMVLPAGDHEVEFRFRALNFDRVSAVTSLFSWLVIVWVAAVATVIFIKKRQKRKNYAGE